MRPILITSSWDDGHPKDLRLADLLNKYAIKGTFYIPKNNSEGRPTMQDKDIQQIATCFEIGGHTMDHVRLKRLGKKEITHQLRDSKKWLEDVTGKRIDGFCYPGGKYNNTVEQVVQREGYTYARTTENFRVDLGHNRFRMPTTLQFFPHSSSVLLRNAAKSMTFYKKLPLAISVASKTSLVERVLIATAKAQHCLGVLHIWGHSWEISENNLWSQLEEVFREVNNHRDKFMFVTNQECYLDIINS